MSLAERTKRRQEAVAPVSGLCCVVRAVHNTELQSGQYQCWLAPKLGLNAGGSADAMVRLNPALDKKNEIEKASDKQKVRPSW